MSRIDFKSFSYHCLTIFQRTVCVYWSTWSDVSIDVGLDRQNSTSEVYGVVFFQCAHACIVIFIMFFSGAALSNERGSMESKIETLQQENKTLRSNLDTEIDTVKIKTKIVSDLTDTVSTLKQKLSQLESENKEKERQLQSIKVCARHDCTWCLTGVIDKVGCEL